MDITYLGHSSFKIVTKALTIITDPFDPATVGLKLPKLEADVVTISHDHDDHNNTSAVSNTKKIIAGPGEYELEGISFIGIRTFHDTKKGAERGKNTIFIIEIGNIRLAHLGDLGHELSESELRAIGDIDVLMVPIGGTYTIGPKEAGKVTRAIDPKYILPMHFQVPGLEPKAFGSLEGSDAFVSDMSLKTESLPKLNIKEGGILAEDQTIVLLENK